MTRTSLDMATSCMIQARVKYLLPTTDPSTRVRPQRLGVISNLARREPVPAGQLYVLLLAPTGKPRAPDAIP